MKGVLSHIYCVSFYPNTALDIPEAKKVTDLSFTLNCMLLDGFLFRKFLLFTSICKKVKKKL